MPELFLSGLGGFTILQHNQQDYAALQIYLSWTMSQQDCKPH